jgi:hypothetical protein
MRQESEALIQQQIFIWLNNTYRNLIIHSVPNGSSTGDARIISQMSQLGMVRGIADLIIWLPNGKAIMVEVKNSTGSQSADQIKIQQKLEKLGGIYILVRSLDDFKQKISLYLTNP